MLQMHQDRNACVQCPVERSHLIRQYRLAKHIIACLKSHPEVERFRCPFNKTHLVESIKAQYHLDNCESSGNVYNSLYVAEPSKNVGTVSLAEACSITPKLLDEDWDAGYATYCPMKMTENQEVTRMTQCVPRSEKKAFKRMERERFAMLQKQNNGLIVHKEEVKEDIEVPLRRPKAIPLSVTLNKSLGNDNSFNVSKHSLNSQFAKSVSACIGQSTDEKENRALKNRSMDERPLPNDDSIGFTKKNVLKSLSTTDIARGANISFSSIGKYLAPQDKAADVTNDTSTKDTSNAAKNTSACSFKTYQTKPIINSSDDSSDSDSSSEDSPVKSVHTFSLPRMPKVLKKPAMGRGLAILYNKERIQAEREKTFDLTAEKSNCSIDAKKFGYED